MDWFDLSVTYIVMDCADKFPHLSFFLFLGLFSFMLCLLFNHSLVALECEGVWRKVQYDKAASVCEFVHAA